MELGWKLVLGSLIGFLGAALGSIGGVGGGGIFVPMFTLIIGFDPKTSTALSKCMIVGSLFYEISLRECSLSKGLLLTWYEICRYDHGGGVLHRVLQPEDAAPDSKSASDRLRSCPPLPTHAHAGDQHRRHLQRYLP